MSLIKAKPTQVRLHYLFDYDPITGVLTHKNPQSNRVKQGDVVGCVGAAGYRYISIDGCLYRAHVAIWAYVTGHWPNNDVDHEDRNRDNNCWTNLREGTRSQNLMNQARKFNNTSGFKGVTSRGNSHSVRFRTDKGIVHIGSFKTAIEAAEVYDREVVKYQGQFSKTNKQLGLIP